MNAAILLAGWTGVFTTRQFLGNELWRWVALLGVLLVSFVIGKTLSFLIQQQATRLRDRRPLRIVQMLLASTAGPANMLILAGGLYLASTIMKLEIRIADESRSLRPFWLNVCATIAAIAFAWFVYRLVDILEHFLGRWAATTESRLDDQLVPLVRKTLRVFVVVVAALFIAQNIFHLQIGPLLAGVGLGGLAFALAARDMLANLFGSITIFADKPFRIGDRIKIRDYDGMIEEVGFRSTRLRTLTGHLVTLPNAVVAGEPIENIGRRSSIRRVLDITVTYDTAPQKLQRGVEIVREMLEGRKVHFPGDRPPRVYFSDFKADSLNIVVYYWFSPPDWWQYLQFNHDFNMELLTRFNRAGIEFAFPTQTIYVKGEAAAKTAEKKKGGR